MNGEDYSQEVDPARKALVTRPEGEGGLSGADWSAAAAAAWLAPADEGQDRISSMRPGGGLILFLRHNLRGSEMKPLPLVDATTSSGA